MSDLDDIPLTFGKYKGKTPEVVGDTDPGYVVWLFKNIKPVPCSRELAQLCEMSVREQEAEWLSAWDWCHNN